MPNDHISILPTSVIDVEKADKRGVDFNAQSSRSTYSPFPAEIAKLCFELFLRDAQHIVDPFAGWGERGYWAREYGKTYTGYDTSEKAIANAKEEFGITNTLGDSRLVTPKAWDGLITCPPYWNLEKYHSESGIDRTKKWDEFLRQYHAILSNFISAAGEKATVCIMVGDWRKNKKYYGLDYETTHIMDKLGYSTFDKVIVSRKKISKIKIMLPQAKRLGYTVKVHETLLVFKRS